jgi:hypothetical protein
MDIEITTQLRIQRSESYWYTVTDRDIDADVDGNCTISYQNCHGEGAIYIIAHREEALAIADAIYKLFGKPKSTEDAS